MYFIDNFTEHNILKWILNKVGNPLIQLKTQDEIKQFKKSENITFILCVDSNSSTYYQNYSDAVTSIQISM